MLVNITYLLLGGAALYFGAEWLVRGAAGLARSFGIRPMIVGLTVVAYGTSAPELVVSCSAALEGKSALALGNVVGSNVANLGLILGVTALISPPRVEQGLIYRELPVLLLTVLAVPLLLWDGMISRVEATALVVASLAFTAFLIRSSRGKRDPSVADPDEAGELGGLSPRSRAGLAGLAVVGLVILLVGGKLFVDGAVALALALGMSERVVGLTVVAIGTSLPEMAASLVAALRGHSAIAVGNVIGSNVFNVLLILGAAGLVSPIEGSLGDLRLDLLTLAGLTALAVVFLRTERVLTRAEGGLLAAVYTAFLVLLVVQW
jgi:cation:H+ antiporter